MKKVVSLALLILVSTELIAPVNAYSIDNTTDSISTKNSTLNADTLSSSQTQDSNESVQETAGEHSSITTDSSQETTREIIESFDLSEFVDKEVKIISDTKPNLEFGENTQNESHVKTSESLIDQNYVFHSTEDGWYTIQNNLTNNYLTVSDTNQSTENEITFTTLTNSDNQKWRVVSQSNGTFIIQAKTNEYYLTISDENTLTLKDSNELSEQRWKLTLFTPPTDTKNRSVATTPINVENGVYQLKNNKTGLFLSLGSLTKTIRTPLIVSQLTNTRESKFEIEKDSDGWYTITNSYSSLVLDVAGGLVSPNTIIQQYNSNNTNAQKFRFVTGANGETVIESKLGLLVDVNNSNSVITNTLSETNSQGWTLTPTEAPRYVEFNSGDYQVTANGSNQVFSISNLIEDIRKSIQLKETTYGAIDLFTLTKTSDGWYQFVNKYSGKVLDIRGGSTASGAVLQQYNANGTDSQKFKFLDAGDGYVYIESKLGLVLERPSNSYSDGLEIKTYQLNETNAQKWKLEAQTIPNLVLPTSGNQYLIQAGTNSNAVIDVSGGSTASGAAIQIWQENIVPQQKFIPYDLGNGWFKLESLKSKKVIDISNANKGARAKVQQYNWNGSNAQQFRFIDAGNGFVYIQSKLGSYLDISGGNSGNGTKIQTYGLNKSKAQKYKFINVNNANVIQTSISSKTTAKITIFNPNNGNVSNVKFPTWSRTNGQDDIKWLNGIRNSDGSWSVMIDSAQFKHGGVFDTHVYATVNGKDQFLGTTSYNLDRPVTQDDTAIRLSKKPYYYSQLDGRWSNIRYGMSTLGPSGCVPTSMAMVLRGHFGINVSPIDTANRLYSYGGFNQRYFGASGTDFVRGMNSYGKTVLTINSLAQLNDYLSKGYPVVMFVNVGIGHAVVAHGYSSGGYTTVYDPYGKQFYNGTVATGTLWSTPSTDSIDWSAGRPYFAIK